MKEVYAKHLQGMVRIPTISNEEENKVDFGKFSEFHNYLEEIFPAIHCTMEKKVIGKANLLYKWKGRSAGEKLPVLLMGHQDVVPAGDPGKWTYPPFSGTIADGCIWGRGTTDCKQVILAEMEAVEELISEGYVPDYDIYLAYAWNEEVQSEVKGATEIISQLEEEEVRLGVVFDEGSGIRKGVISGQEGYICQLELGEKAYQDYELYVDCPGGHAMEPGSGTALGAVARAVVAVEEHPFPYRLTPLVENHLKALSVFEEGEKAIIFSDPEIHWEKLCQLAKEDRKLDALLHTTCAATMASASEQANILPNHASVILNCRLLEGDSTEKLLEHFKAIIPAEVNVRKLRGDDPEPACSVNGRPYQLIEEIAKERYGENVCMVPALLAGGTDARFYTEISENVFRHTGIFRDERWGNAHQTDERIPIDCLESSVQFYKDFLTRY